jgi:hypothetical protein
MNNPNPPLPDPQAVMQEQMAQMVAFDVPRSWATAAQAFKLEGTVLLIFREGMILSNVPEPGQLNLPQIQQAVMRNITSVVIPIKVAAELGKILSVMAEEAGETNGPAA